MKVSIQNGPRVSSTAQLAARLGVSRWTVSRALNGQPGVNAGTVARVEQAARDWGFTPNLFARGLRSGRTNLVGICVPELEEAYLSPKLSHLNDRLAVLGLRPLVEMTGENPGREEEILRQFASMKVAGVIVIGLQSEAALQVVKDLRTQGIPVVLIDPLGGLMDGAVVVDRARALELAVDHLHGKGHRKFAVLGIDPSTPYGRMRMAGLEGGCRRFGLEWGQSIWMYRLDEAEHMDGAYGTRLAGMFLDGGKKATALIALNDRVAIGAMKELSRRGCGVPEDVSVIGYDNMDIGAYMTPALTTVDANKDRLVADSIGLMQEALREGANRRRKGISVEPYVVVRESTGNSNGN